MKSLLCIIIFSVIVGFILSSCVEPVMSCAGIKTYPRCAKFCTHNAVATCEGNVQRALMENNRNFLRSMVKFQNFDNEDDNY